MVRLGVIVPRASPLAQRTELALADLAGQDLVLPPRTTAPGWHDHVLDVCRQRTYTPARVRHARNPEFLLGLVLAGHGVAFEPESAARREPRLVWRPATLQPPGRRNRRTPRRNGSPRSPRRR